MVRRSLLALALGLVSILVQGTLIKAIYPGAVVPGLLLILIVFLAFYEPSVFGVGLAFLLGLELDMCSGLLLGPWAGASVIVFGIVASLSQRIFVESPFAVMMTVFLSSILSNFVWLLIVLQVQRSGLFSWTLVFEALLTAAVCVPLFSLYRRLFAVELAAAARR
jgi:rod shape-determining protein MreD